MGGMHGMGPITQESSEPVFHEKWEGRVYAMYRAIAAWNKWSLDASRHGIEVIAPAEYLRMSYYERWLARDIDLMVKRGLVAQQEIDTGRPAPGSPRANPPLTAPMVPAMAAERANFRRLQADAKARFKIGQHVRAREMNPVGHTRLPRYVRGHRGVIFRHHGIFVFPDTNAHFQGEHPQHLYSVRFSARELWGDAALPRDSVNLDMWDSYLEHA
jgi:nitrile hydratase